MMQSPLSEQQELYRILTEKSLAGIYVVQDGIFKFLNHNAASYTGYTADDLMGKSPDSIIHPDDREAAREKARAMLAGKEPSPSEFRILTRDGRIRWIMETIVPITWEGNAALLGNSMDITEKKAFEQAIFERQERFRVLYESANDALFLMEDYRFIDCNPKALEMFQCSREQIIGQTPTRFSPPLQQDGGDSLQGAVLRMNAALAGCPQSFEWHHCRFDGTPFHTEVSLKGLELSGKQYIQAIVRDIDERKKMEQALMDSERKYRHLFERSAEGILIVRGENIVFVNPALADMLGGPVSRIIARPFVIFVHPDDREMVLNGYRRKMSVQRVEKTSDDLRIVALDGTVRWVRITSQTIDWEGEPASLNFLIDITERRKAEETLRASEEFSARLISAIPDIVIRTDIEGNILFVNDRGLEASPCSGDEIIGKNMLSFIAPEDVERAVQNTLLMMERPLGPREYHLYLREGKRLYEVNGDVLKTEEGTPYSMIYVLRDITERRQAEEALRENEERLRTIIEGTHAALVSVDINGRFTYANEAMAHELGYKTPETLIGRSYVHFIHPDDRKRVMNTFISQVNARRQSTTQEFRVVDKDGNIKWFSFLSTLAVKDGQPVGQSGVAQNITERKLAEEALWKSEKKFRGIFESLQDVYFRCNQHGIIEIISPSVKQLGGYDERELIGKSVLDVFTDTADRDRFMATLLREGRASDYELNLKLKSGRVFTASLNTLLIRENGRITGVEGTIRDVTKQKKQEEELLLLNQELENAIARANTLAVQSEIANIAKSEFLANMSHEIRTPMNGVIGMTGLLLDTELSEEQRRYAEIVRASGESLLRLINDILDFSKIEAGKLVMDALDFDLHSLLQDFEAAMAIRAHEKGLELYCIMHPEVPPLLRGDPGRLRQILTNLAGNAVKFTDQGEVTIRVSTAAEKTQDTPGKQRGRRDILLRFSVHDTGIGIPEHKTGLLFRKFSQADASTTRQYGGTGLGLAISKQLAELMGGEVGVNSEEGRGSEFWFTVRLEQQPEGARAMPPPPAELAGVRVLIVDDNATAREILMTRLASWGMRPAEAPDGPSALQAIYEALEKGDPFGIAAIDMQMATMDGETLGKAIRADGRLATLKMVMLTSLGKRGDAGRLADMGFNGYLPKPVQHQEMKAVLSQVLAQRDGGTPKTALVTRHTAREARKRFAGCKARILLADDNMTNQQVALGILGKWGLNADAVASGTEALKALQTIPYDLVLMDVQMPEMDGLEATRHIRNPKSAVLDHAIPVIAMTAHAMAGDREKCMEAGMNDYVSKPVAPEALAAALERCLSRRETEPPGVGALSEPEQPEQAAATETDAPVWDRNGMMERLMGDGDLAAVIMKGFLEDIPRQIETLGHMLGDNDRSGVERQAHTIKGASANVGGEALRETAYEMEMAARAGDMNAAGSGMQMLRDRFDRLKREMEACLSDRRG